MAGGNVTPEACRKEFEGLGLSLTLDEAQELLKSTQRAMDMSPEELDNVVLETVSGGGQGTALALTGTSILADMISVGCGVTGIVYQFKAQSALKRGDLDTGTKYNGRSLKLWGASLGLSVGTTVFGLAAKGAAGVDSSQDQNAN